MMILQSQGGQRCKMQALCLAALEIVLEEIEGHLDDGEVEHPDRQIAFTQISDFAQMSRVYSDIWVCSDIWPYSDILLYSDIWVCSDIWLYSDAVGVLIISPTVGGCELGGLRSNVDSEGGKYTSAIASVYLPPSSSTLRWSCTRCLNHRLRSNVDSEVGKYTSAIASVYLPPSSSTLRWSCTRRKASIPQATSTQVPLVQVQVQLSYHLETWTWTWGDLSRVSGWATRATSLKVHLVKTKATSAIPSVALTWAESAKSTSPTVGLVQKFVHVLESERVKNWSWSIIKQKQSRSFWSLSFWLSWTLLA